MNHLLKAAATVVVMAFVLASTVASAGVLAKAAEPKTALDCKAPTAQKQMNDCAYEDFLAANAGYAETSKSISTGLSGKQRDLFRRSQKAWVAYSTAACDFQSSAVQGGSAQGMVKWQCMARMSRARVVELQAIGNCAEGDVSCVRLKK